MGFSFIRSDVYEVKEEGLRSVEVVVGSCEVGEIATGIVVRLVRFSVSDCFLRETVFGGLGFVFVIKRVRGPNVVNYWYYARGL